MQTAAQITAPETPEVTFEDLPRQTKKDTFLLGNLPMPDDPGLRDGAKNRLKVSVRYIKDGMGRQGRGIYLTLTGHAYDGTFESFRLYQDPSVYVLIQPMGRFNAKKLAEAAAGAAEAHQGLLLQHVAEATAYYEGLARKAAPAYAHGPGPHEDSRL
jgi:hypothetical protein